jgi:hypothetical protein
MELYGQAYLLQTLKVLGDESRLKLLQMLNNQELIVGDLAERMALTEPTVSYHLAKLREVGLVTLRMAGNQRYYRINEGGLARFKQVISTIEQPPPEAKKIEADNNWIEALDWAEEEKQVLRDHTVNGELTRIPAKQKKLVVVLRWLASLFEADKLYAEKEVNAVLKSVHTHDYVGLRRDLVDFGYLRREPGGSKYWLTPANERTPVS